MKYVKNIVLLIMDGWGLNNKKDGNAIKLANTPNMDSYYKKYPFSKLKSFGEDVGLPDKQMGNSEVGHLNIGAGRIVYQPLTKISLDIKKGCFFNNPVFEQSMIHAKRNNSALHLMGLLSDGGVHSHINHLFALIDLVKKYNIKNVFIHAFLDGRDVPPRCAKKYFKELENKLKTAKVGKLATVIGRYYSMDRDNRWERTHIAYEALVNNKGFRSTSGIKATEEGYKRGEDDEFIKPTIIIDNKNGNPIASIKDNDSIIFYNFRPDRARQITRAINNINFIYFKNKIFKNIKFACMCEYDETFNLPVAYPKEDIENDLGEVITKHSMTQLRIAETEKYAHVTYFFSGGKELQYKGETRILIPSPKVATYNLKPEMSAYEVTDRVIEEIRRKKHNLIVLNYANPDMVGHTGFLNAAKEAIKTVDTCVGKVVDETLKIDGAVLITGDHGNAEQMIDFSTHNPFTAHTSNYVPLILAGNKIKYNLKNGKLADIAPTILELLGISKPEEMTGKSLLK
ncbi:MAG: 2,3-bisphosphoglycerate-independent phosphoglycerate mutase [Candidatus Firestonebacteria bacterium]|nr:2,3-bisphosphoglycerate-independent phosphoglycerate mutase [Candidatus Firestonebacteria bacterium]